MSFDPYAPYGPVVGTTMRIATWNVWGRFGDAEARQAGIEEALAAVEPDVVCLVESWSTPEGHQADRVGDRLGLAHRLFVGDWDQEGWTSGIGVASRWPVTTHERIPLRGDDGSGTGEALFVALDGPRGLVQLYAVMLDHPLGASGLRQAQVRRLVEHVDRTTRRRHPVVLCGDFNAGPDSDEIRMLTGRSAVPVPDLVFYDAWEVAGDGTPGHTWSNRNPLAALSLWPDRRIDHILSAWPRAGGVGHPTRCALLGVPATPGATPLSDHHGLVADLRY
ncbi:MAG TPA: endonuclease/exonuclease/phosphatase family protein [Iamia sp.]|nr:endonuclease/exonuclease/phosphatase family protein [Iamia sp.]